VPLCTPSLRPSGQPPKRCRRLSCDRPLMRKNLQTWLGLRGQCYCPPARPTLLLLKELLCILCIRRGVSCSQRGDGEEHRHKLRHRLCHELGHRLRHKSRLGASSWLRSLHPQAACSTARTNGVTDANRWVSHARVKRSDQSCRRHHSQKRFVQGCCSICIVCSSVTDSEHRSIKSRSRLEA
jgi:hypothetical protein